MVGLSWRAAVDQICIFPRNFAPAEFFSGAAQP
jgi:hypothetical protein